jgi:hypothetical protein
MQDQEPDPTEERDHPDRLAQGGLTEDLARARRQAFSRGATDDDLERLRELEERAARTSPVLPEIDVLAASERRAAEPAGGAEAAPDDEKRTGRRAWIRPAVLGALGGALVGILVATVTSPLFWASRPMGLMVTDEPTATELGPSLAIFDRTPSERDVLGAAGFPDMLFDPDSGTPEVRWLADLDGATFYAARGEREGEVSICLLAVRQSSAGGGCSTVAEFEVAGLGGTFEGLSVRWGPYGLAPWVPYEPEAR